MKENNHFGKYMIKIREKRWRTTWDVFLKEYCTLTLNKNNIDSNSSYVYSINYDNVTMFYDQYVEFLKCNGVKQIVTIVQLT